jgi:hypothetical protein
MHSGSELVETWTPVGEFKLERRRARTPDGGAVLAECPVPKWEIDDLMPDHPCARQPCLHRIAGSLRSNSFRSHSHSWSTGFASDDQTK